jgi:hypothetical protein
MTVAPPSPPSPTTPAPRRRRGPGLVLVLLVPVLVLLLALYVWVALRISYSEGERAGYVQKFSRKGWVCKTWEGEIAMVTLPGTAPEIFRFTVREDRVAEQINRSMGQRVTLHYEQHPGVPTTCFGETDYFVTAVRAIGP